MKSVSLIFLAFIILFGCSPDVFADELLLTNGKTLKGRVIQKTPESVKLEVCYGTVDLKINEIVYIKSVPLKNNYLFLAEGYAARDDMEKAREFYSLALEVDSEYKEAKEGLVQLKERKKQLQKLKDKKEKRIFELNESALQKSGQENYPAAIRDIKEAYGLDRRNHLTGENLVQVYLNYGWHLFRSGKKGRAVKVLEEGTKLFPGNVELPALLGEFYKRKGDLEKAVSIWESVLKSAPSNRHLLESLEAVYRLQREKLPAIYYYGRLFRFRAPEGINLEERTLLDGIIADFQEAGQKLGADLFYYPPEITEVLVYTEKVVSPVVFSGIMYNGKEIIVSLPGVKELSEGKINSRIIYVCANLFLHSQMGDDFPLWLREGYALYRSGASSRENLLREALEKKTFYKLRKVEEYLKKGNFGEERELVSAECLGFVSFLAENYGERFLYDALKEIAQGTDYEDAFDTYFAADFHRLEKEWIKIIESGD